MNTLKTIGVLTNTNANQFINHRACKPTKTNIMSTILEFRIGRGGRFNNGGHLSFDGISKGISYTHAFDSLFPPSYKNGNEDLRTLKAEWVNDQGNSVGLTNADVKSGIGRIDIDGNYNTTYTTYADQLDENEAFLVFEDAEKFNGKYVWLLPVDEIITEVSRQTIEKAAQKGLLKDLYNYAFYGTQNEQTFIDEYLNEEE